mmetsp:Transcript_122917/g.358765  ORF Transcript_122917/g.358765 Transcript_122917/m.358765 type:complete len:287 (+) Transcript_122917:238-1098(+)
MGRRRRGAATVQEDGSMLLHHIAELRYHLEAGGMYREVPLKVGRGQEHAARNLKQAAPTLKQNMHIPILVKKVYISPCVSADGPPRHGQCRDLMRPRHSPAQRHLSMIFSHAKKVRYLPPLQGFSTRAMAAEHNVHDAVGRELPKEPRGLFHRGNALELHGTSLLTPDCQAVADVLVDAESTVMILRGVKPNDVVLAADLVVPKACQIQIQSPVQAIHGLKGIHLLVGALEVDETGQPTATQRQLADVVAHQVSPNIFFAQIEKALGCWGLNLRGGSTAVFPWLPW